MTVGIEGQGFGIDCCADDAEQDEAIASSNFEYCRTAKKTLYIDLGSCGYQRELTNRIGLKIESVGSSLGHW